MNRRNWIMTGLLLVAIVSALAAPLGGGRAHAQTPDARVRFLHAVPGGPGVDVYLDGAVVASGLAFGDVTPHLNVAGGEHQVALRQSGAGADSPALLEVVVPLVPSLAFSVVVQGAPGQIEAALYEDILDEIEPGMARLTAINAIADAPPLDVLTTAGGPLLQGVNYGAQFGTVNIGAGVQDLVMVPAGGAVESAVVTIGEVPLVSGILYTFVALGTLEGSTAPSALVLATPVNEAEGSVRVRFAHGSADTLAVDVYANDTLLVPALTLGDLTGHVALPAGAYAVALRPAGAPAADEPVITADLELDAATPAVTVAFTGEQGDGTLALQTFTDNVAGIQPAMARVTVLNTVPGAVVDVTLTDTSGTVLASALAAGAQGTALDIVPGEYMVAVSITGADAPVDLLIPANVYNGGMYYTVLVFGGGEAAVPFNATVLGTEINVTVDSLPVPAPVMVAEPADTTPADEAAVQDTPSTDDAETPEQQAAENTELVQVPTETTEVVPPQATPAPAQPTQPPLALQPVAYVELNPGANLHCRELPGADKRSLGLIPSGAIVTVNGRTGTPLVPETGEATPEPTPVVESVEDLWLSVRWEPESGGYLRCWVSAQFLRVEYRGRLLDELDELWALPEEPFNRPGEAVDTDVTPPTPLFNAVVATVDLAPGVSLQLRRYPNSNSESLGLVPAQSQLEVLGYAEVPSEGLVGQPTSPYWLYVRFRQEDGSATVGWVSAQYVTLSRLGRPVELDAVIVVDAAEPGYYEAPGQTSLAPIKMDEVIGTVNLNPGANLNLRDRPSADARVVVGIPSGESVIINGRNGDGTWVQVTYETSAGDLEGWVASQYLIITRGGNAYDINRLEILTGEPDSMGS